MTTAEARKVFDEAIANTTDPDAIAKIELAREYFTNAEFRQAFTEHIVEEVTR